MVLGAVIGAAVGIGSSLFGASSANKQAKNDRKAQQAQIESTYKSQVAEWEFNNNNNQRNWQFAQASAQLNRDLERAVALESWKTDNATSQAEWIVQAANLSMGTMYTNASNQRDVDFQRTMQAADYRAQMMSYQQSERTHSINTQLISQATAQAYSYQKTMLSYERQGMASERQDTHIKYEQTKVDSINTAKQQEAKYRDVLKQSGYQGEELQSAVNEKMAEFARNQDKVQRDGNAKAGQAAASGRQGNSANRVMMDPLNQASLAVGSLAIELSFFGQARNREMLKLAEATNLAGFLTDQERQQINNQMNTETSTSNLALSDNNRKERQAIDNANFEMEDAYLQGQSQINQSESNRELFPMDPVKIQDPLLVPNTILSQPFQRSMPLAAQDGFNPLPIPRPLVAPKPLKGASPAKSSPGNAIAVQGIASGVTDVIGAIGRSQAISPIPTPRV